MKPLRAIPGLGLSLGWLLAAFSTLCASARQSEPTAAQPAPPNRVLELDGRASYVEMPSASLEGLAEFTLEAWVKPAQFGRGSVFLHIGSFAAEARHFVLEAGQGAARNEVFVSLRPTRNSRPLFWATELQLRTNHWYHLAISIQGNQCWSYLNGSLFAAAELPLAVRPADATSLFRLGRSVGTAASADPDPSDLAGQMDEVRLWRVAREPEQIRRTMFLRLKGDEPDLVGLWNFDDGSARDATPGAGHGRLFGGAGIIPALWPDAGELQRFAQALVLDGQDSYVELPVSAFTSLREATIECWVRPASFERWLNHRIFSFGEVFQDLHLGFREGNPHLHFNLHSPAYSAGSGIRSDLELNRWYHAAATSGPEGMRLYLNGALLATNAFTGSFADLDAAGPAFIGKWTASYVEAGPSFHGEIAEFRVWKGERTEQELRENMFQRLTGTEDGLVALWNFAEGTARDHSTNGYHGELKGNAKILAQRLPEPADVIAPAIVHARVADERGAALPFFQMHVLEEGVPTLSFTNIVVMRTMLPNLSNGTNLSSASIPKAARTSLWSRAETSAIR